MAAAWAVVSIAHLDAVDVVIVGWGGHESGEEAADTFVHVGSS